MGKPCAPALASGWVSRLWPASARSGKVQPLDKVPWQLLTALLSDVGILGEKACAATFASQLGGAGAPLPATGCSAFLSPAPALWPVEKRRPQTSVSLLLSPACTSCKVRKAFAVTLGNCVFLPFPFLHWRGSGGSESSDWLDPSGKSPSAAKLMCRC